MKNETPKMKQLELANQLGYYSSTLQRYGIDIHMLSPYRNQPNDANKRTKKTSNTNFDNNSHGDPDVKRPQITSNHLKWPQTNSNKYNTGEEKQKRSES